MKKEIKYSEPLSYFPKKVRKKYGLGEFEKNDSNQETEVKNPKNENR